MIPEEIRDSLPGPVLSSRPLGGGSINEVYQIVTQEGPFCLKFNRAQSFPGMFDAEARGLQILGTTSTVGVPSVLKSETLASWSYLLLEYIHPAPAGDAVMEQFGRKLGALHRVTSGMFGLDHDNYMGSLPQSNRPHAAWRDFFLAERIEPQVRRACNQGMAEGGDLVRFDRLGSWLDAWVPDEPPALIHGDLWGGNYLTDKNGNAFLIDPAVHYGHRESDLAMTTLFGGFGKAFYRGYQESNPMEPGWEDRFDIYNLYPLLVHLNLFGRSYLSPIRSVLERYC